MKERFDRFATIAAAAFASAILCGCPKAQEPETEAEPEPPEYMTNETQRAAWRRMHDKEYVAKLHGQEDKMKAVAKKIEEANRALQEAKENGAPEEEVEKLANALSAVYKEMDAAMKRSQEIVREQIIKDHLKHGNLRQKKGETK